MSELNREQVQFRNGKFQLKGKKELHFLFEFGYSFLFHQSVRAARSILELVVINWSMFVLLLYN